MIPARLFLARYSLPSKVLQRTGTGTPADAIKRGAAAVVCQDPVSVNGLVLRVSKIRVRPWRPLPAGFMAIHRKDLVMIGVTGTNGKTTVTYLLENILEEAGYRPGVVGTVNYRFAGDVFDNPVTTPESLELQQILRKMVDKRVTHVVMEVSSHALDLSRVTDAATIWVYSPISRRIIWITTGIWTGIGPAKRGCSPIT
jgi:UDP-N-acetylmuramyl tripeptide synthase